jgi:hypothetical protein
LSKLSVHQIRGLAKELIAANPGGVRYSQLVREIHTRHPETPVNTIHGSVWNLDAVLPKEIVKPSRGLFQPANAAEEGGIEEQSESIIEITPQGKKVTELDFYEPFAEWLMSDLGEVTAVASLGGSGIKAKWGTPDVVGVYKPSASNLLSFLSR